MDHGQAARPVLHDGCPGDQAMKIGRGHHQRLQVHVVLHRGRRRHSGSGTRTPRNRDGSSRSRRLLAPGTPGQDHCRGAELPGPCRWRWALHLPEEPILFMKPVNSVIGPGDDHRLPGAVRTGWTTRRSLPWSSRRQCRDVEAGRCAGLSSSATPA
ncbi:MAG: hypothetical protein MZV70_73115 [Desulfobacterales bacterium]|nr:hypothetical protein [Desulfobacterales bacterium]